MIGNIKQVAILLSIPKRLKILKHILEVRKDDVEIIKTVTTLEATNPLCIIQCNIDCHAERGNQNFRKGLQ